jgi:hypothetical protein
MRKDRIFKTVSGLLFVLSGFLFGLGLQQIVFQGFQKGFTIHFYLFVMGATLMCIIAYLLRNSRIKNINMQLEVIDFLLAYREYEEQNLVGLVKGSNEWLNRLEPFYGVCKKHGHAWEFLFQTVIEDETYDI